MCYCIYVTNSFHSYIADCIKIGKLYIEQKYNFADASLECTSCESNSTLDKNTEVHSLNVIPINQIDSKHAEQACPH